MKELRLFDSKNSIEIITNNTGIDNTVINAIKKRTDLFFNVMPIEKDFTIDKSETIDIIALDAVYNPVILLFQKLEHENVINKGLYYLDWIVEHNASLNELIIKALPYIKTDKINWISPRLLCISDSFSKYDRHIVSQVGRNIELISYRQFGDGLILFDGMKEQIKNSAPEEARQVKAYLEQEEAKRQFRPPSTVFKIGYCKIEDNKHYVVFPNKDVKEIEDLPVMIYLAEGQFVLIDEYSRFKYAFPYKIGYNELSQTVSSFAVVSIKDSDIYIEKGDSILYKLNNIPPTVQLRDKNIVSIDAQDNFIRFYKPVKHNADSFLPSAKAKGHQMAFVLKILQDGVVLRDIETGKEFIKCLEADGIGFNENQVICIRENKSLIAFNSSKFYTLSSYYDRFEYGIIEIKEGLVYLKKLTGEKVIIKDAPTFLYSGQVAYVDENNNFCGIEDNGGEADADAVKKNVTNIRTFRKTNRTSTIEVTKQVLVLGNKTYENSYKLCLLKYGFKAEVLEGFESWAKISSELKESDIVVVITSHISHDNMWKIKKEITDIPVIYSEFDGANRILEQVLALEQDKESMPING